VTWAAERSNRSLSAAMPASASCVRERIATIRVYGQRRRHLSNDWVGGESAQSARWPLTADSVVIFHWSGNALAHHSLGGEARGRHSSLITRLGD
jgi:hypothetical protein